MTDFTFGMILTLSIFGFIIGFLPTFVSIWRDTKATMGIFIVNFFLGWTFVGWVLALAWAASADLKTQG